jgi:hypothetical protein
MDQNYRIRPGGQLPVWTSGILENSQADYPRRTGLA